MKVPSCLKVPKVERGSDALIAAYNNTKQLALSSSMPSFKHTSKKALWWVTGHYPKHDRLLEALYPSNGAGDMGLSLLT